MLRSEAPLPKDAGPDYPDYLYEVCFGDRIKQIPHPYTENRVVMGVFAGWGEGGGGKGGATQLYTEGTLCEGWGKREVSVKVSCDASAVASPRILDVQEPEVCKYTMHLVTAAAC